MTKTSLRWLGGLAKLMALVKTPTPGWGRSGLALASLLVLTPTDASAQQPLNRFTVAGTVGFGSFWSDESRVGQGPIFGGAVRFQPWTHWGFELDLRRYTHERRFEHSDVVFAGEGVALTTSVAYYFRTSDVQPFIRGGIGILRFDRERRSPIRAGPSLSTFPHDPFTVIGENVFRSKDTAVGLSLGGGVGVPLGERWSIRPEAGALFGAGAVISSIDVGASMGYGW